MKLSGVEITQGGIKGASLFYTKIEDSNGQSFQNIYKKRQMTPVHSEALVLINKLKYHYLKLLGYWKDEYNECIIEDEYVVDVTKTKSNHYLRVCDLFKRIEIIGAHMKGAGFMIKGKFILLETNKKISVTTSVVTMDDGYDMFDDVVDIITKKIFPEMKEYESGKRRADAEQYARTLFTQEGKSKEEISELMDNMNKDDYEDLMNERLAKEGAILLNDVTDEDLGIEDEDDGPWDEPEETGFEEVEEDPKLTVVADEAIDSIEKAKNTGSVVVPVDNFKEAV